MLRKALTGRGLHVDPFLPTNTRNIYIPKEGKQREKLKKIKIWQGFTPWEEQPIQQHSDFRRNILSKVSGVEKPLSSLDLNDWVEKLGIKKFRGVFSRDNLPKRIRKEECGIINLDDFSGPGTHWVCWRNIEGEDICEYFDSFGLPMPTEVMEYLIKSGKTLFYSPDEIQERSSVLCGYILLVFILFIRKAERQKYF